MALTGYLEPNRLRKSRRVLGAFIAGAGGRSLSTSTLDMDADDHAFYGQLWSAARLIPDCIRAGQHYWHVDNGWVLPGRGEMNGYYRVTRDGMVPHFLPGLDPRRALDLGVRIQPWRQDGGHVLIAMPGPNYGTPWGVSMGPWAATIEARVRAHTKRPVLVRTKETARTMADDLAGAWCVVTHSSNSAVDAVLAGVPAIVEDTSPTAPLGNVGLGWMRDPYLSPDRGEWLASLAWQQFTPGEMRGGLAWEALHRLLPPRGPAGA